MHKRSFLLAATSSTALGIWGCSQDDGSLSTLDPVLSEPEARAPAFDPVLSEPGAGVPALAPVVRERAYGARVVSTSLGRRFAFSTGELPLTELDDDDQPVLVIGRFGTGRADLNAPTGVLEAPNGDLYVVDRGNSRIQVYDAAGRHLRSLARWGKGEGELSAPASAAWTRDGRLAVADALNHRIVIFEPDGSGSHSFGALGSGDGEFNLPREIVCDGEGRLVVLDRGNQRLQFFSADGQFLSSVEVPELISPRSLIAAADGNLLLADPGRGVVASLSRDGAMSFQLLELPAGGKAAVPHALELAPEGKLYVYATSEPAGE